MLLPLDNVKKTTELITALWKGLGKPPPVLAAPFLDSAYVYTDWFSVQFSAESIFYKFLQQYNEEGMILSVKDPFTDKSFWLVYTKKNHF